MFKNVQLDRKKNNMKFRLFYQYQKASYIKVYPHTLKASSAENAFRKAIEIMKQNYKIPDEFSVFYVCCSDTQFKRQQHGWDRSGDLRSKEVEIK